MVRGVGLGLLTLVIILFPVDKQYHIGILLDLARFPKVRQQGAFVFPRFDLTGKLGESQNRNV